MRTLRAHYFLKLLELIEVKGGHMLDTRWTQGVGWGVDLKISFNRSKRHENNPSATLDHKQQLSMLSVLFRWITITVIISLKFSVSCLEHFGHLAVLKTSKCVKRQTCHRAAGDLPGSSSCTRGVSFLFTLIQHLAHGANYHLSRSKVEMLISNKQEVVNMLPKSL